jgi:hypothetical protein
MRNFSKLLLPVTLLFCLWTGPNNLLAQANADQGIQIIASPKGTVVHLHGEYSVAGSTPYILNQNLDGVYQIKARRPGYENYTAKFRFKPGVSHRISIRLTPKTRGRAFLRSMFIPGWGQSYTDQLTKAYFIRSLTVGALTYFIVRDVKYQRAVDDFEAAVKMYEANQKNSELAEALLLDVQSAQVIVDNRFESRRTALLILGSVYAYNLLDALLFFPDFEVAGVSFSFNPNYENSSLKLGLTARL